MKPLAVLRPEPGNAATSARIAAGGGVALALPLFEVRSLPWTPPPAARFDALFLTSANAVRHAGAALASYRDVPVFAVGNATAASAQAAGLTVAAVGDGDAVALAALAKEHGVRAALHLTSRDRTHASLPGVVVTIAVYASETTEPTTKQLAALAGAVTLIHSPRAGTRLAEIAPDRSATCIAAISPAALATAGAGWAAAAVAEQPNDESLIAAALALAN